MRDQTPWLDSPYVILGAALGLAFGFFVVGPLLFGPIAP